MSTYFTVNYKQYSTKEVANPILSWADPNYRNYVRSLLRLFLYDDILPTIFEYMMSITLILKNNWNQEPDRKNRITDGARISVFNDELFALDSYEINSSIQIFNPLTGKFLRKLDFKDGNPISIMTTVIDNIPTLVVLDVIIQILIDTTFKIFHRVKSFNIDDMKLNENFSWEISRQYNSNNNNIIIEDIKRLKKSDLFFNLPEQKFYLKYPKDRHCTTTLHEHSGRKVGVYSPNGKLERTITFRPRPMPDISRMYVDDDEMFFVLASGTNITVRNKNNGTLIRKYDITDIFKLALQNQLIFCDCLAINGEQVIAGTEVSNYNTYQGLVILDRGTCDVLKIINRTDSWMYAKDICINKANLFVSYGNRLKTEILVFE